MIKFELNDEIAKILSLPEVPSRLQDLGIEIVGSTPEELGRDHSGRSAEGAEVAKDAEVR